MHGRLRRLEASGKPVACADSLTPLAIPPFRPTCLVAGGGALAMPEWREQLQKKLSDTAQPSIKMSFEAASGPDFRDPLFRDVLKAMCKMNGCKTVVTQTCATYDEMRPSSGFTRLLLHDAPKDLEKVKGPKKKRPKASKGPEKPGRGASEQPPRRPDKKAAGKTRARSRPSKPTQRYQCWVLQ
ncbi:unnamed protein product [Prorocentrum cordatum]|uniref:Uncharacterized protein n=1 Tax=Prorocentrum cordatum TaxID=2364126 RepID=A0ABN9X1J8_9DINO|nr:unnamed protein product [Polarella glacialis]